MKLFPTSLLFISSGGLAMGASQMDRPVHFAAADEVLTLAYRPPPELDPDFGEAMTYLIVYADQDTLADSTLRKTLLLALAQDRTPRQMMVLGFALRLEGMKSAVAEDELRIAKKERLFAGETTEESRKLFQLRIDQGRGQIACLKSPIDRLLRKAPNKTPQSTTPSVTPPAGQEARQP